MVVYAPIWMSVLALISFTAGVTAEALTYGVWLDLAFAVPIVLGVALATVASAASR